MARSADTRPTSRNSGASRAFRVQVAPQADSSESYRAVIEPVDDAAQVLAGAQFSFGDSVLDIIDHLIAEIARNDGDRQADVVDDHTT
jgi:hypothetical protein